MTNREIRLLLLARDFRVAEKFRSFLALTHGLPYAIVSKDSVQGAVDDCEKFPPQMVVIDFAEADAVEAAGQLLEKVNELSIPCGVVGLLSPTQPVSPHELARCGVTDTLTHGSFDAQLLDQTLRFSRERKRSQLMLAREQSLLRELLSNTPDKIYFKDKSSRFIRVNEAMFRAYNCSKAEEMIGKNDFDLFSAEHAEQAYADEQRIIETGEPIIGKEEKETFNDGTTAWAHTTKLPLRNARGEIIGTMGISRDITPQKQAELALDRERVLLATIMQVLPDNVFVKDSQGRYVMSNPAHRKDLNVESNDDIVGRSAHDFFPEVLANRMTQEDLAVIDESAPLYNVEELRPATDRHPERWLLTSKIPFADPVTGSNFLVGISRDISEQKKVQKKLEETILELRATQMELIESEKLKTVGRLAAGVAHEVKNPLNIVSMGLDSLVLHDISPEERSEVAAQVKAALKRANEVILQLLDFSRADGIDRTASSINDVVQRVLHLIHHKLNASKVKVVLELEEALPEVLLDVSRMEQVLINLIFNSIDAMPEGGEVKVSTRLQVIDSPGNEPGNILVERFSMGDKAIVVQIEDSGCGIPPDDLARVFEPFFSTNNSGKSSGLGLMVAKNIVDLHQGIILLENRDSGGARAKIYLKPVSSENHHESRNPETR